jgi:hypothetical protein
MPKAAKGVNWPNWVQCDKCDRYEVYENCGFVGEYDQQKVETLKFVCKFCEMAEWKNGVNVRVTELEEWKNGANERVSVLETELKEVRECLERVGQRVDVVKEDSVKVVQAECVSVSEKQAETVVRLDVIGMSVSEVQESVGKLGEKLGEVEGTLAEMGVKQLGFEELLERKKEAQLLFTEVISARKLKESRRAIQAEQIDGAAVASIAGSVDGEVAGGSGGVAGAAQQTNGPSFAMKCAELKAGTVLVVGSSMARGVGQHLKKDNIMFGKLDFSGARIEHIRENIAVLGDRPDSHIVVMAGTNNLESDEINVMMKKYHDLVVELKKHEFREVSIVNLLKRADRKLDSKISQVNSQLKALCQAQGIGFVQTAVDTRWMLAPDGVHLNWKGCDRVARAIFKHSCRSLNLG